MSTTGIAKGCLVTHALSKTLTTCWKGTYQPLGSITGGPNPAFGTVSAVESVLAWDQLVRRFPYVAA